MSCEQELTNHCDFSERCVCDFPETTCERKSCNKFGGCPSSDNSHDVVGGNGTLSELL